MELVLLGALVLAVLHPEYSHSQPAETWRKQFQPAASHYHPVVSNASKNTKIKIYPPYPKFSAVGPEIKPAVHQKPRAPDYGILGSFRHKRSSPLDSPMNAPLNNLPFAPAVPDPPMEVGTVRIDITSRMGPQGSRFRGTRKKMLVHATQPPTEPPTTFPITNEDPTEPPTTLPITSGDPTVPPTPQQDLPSLPPSTATSLHLPSKFEIHIIRDDAATHHMSWKDVHSTTRSTDTTCCQETTKENELTAEKSTTESDEEPEVESETNLPMLSSKPKIDKFQGAFEINPPQDAPDSATSSFQAMDTTAQDQPAQFHGFQNSGMKHSTRDSMFHSFGRNPNLQIITTPSGFELIGNPQVLESRLHELVTERSGQDFQFGRNEEVEQAGLDPGSTVGLLEIVQGCHEQLASCQKKLKQAPSINIYHQMIRGNANNEPPVAEQPFPTSQVLFGKDFQKGAESWNSLNPILLEEHERNSPQVSDTPGGIHLIVPFTMQSGSANSMNGLPQMSARERSPTNILQESTDSHTQHLSQVYRQNQLKSIREPLEDEDFSKIQLSDIEKLLNHANHQLNMKTASRGFVDPYPISKSPSEYFTTWPSIGTKHHENSQISHMENGEENTVKNLKDSSVRNSFRNLKKRKRKFLRNQIKAQPFPSPTGNEVPDTGKDDNIRDLEKLETDQKIFRNAAQAFHGNNIPSSKNVDSQNSIPQPGDLKNSLWKAEKNRNIDPDINLEKAKKSTSEVVRKGFLPYSIKLGMRDALSNELHHVSIELQSKHTQNGSSKPQKKYLALYLDESSDSSEGSEGKEQEVIKLTTLNAIPAQPENITQQAPQNVSVSQANTPSNTSMSPANACLMNSTLPDNKSAGDDGPSANNTTTLSAPVPIPTDAKFEFNTSTAIVSLNTTTSMKPNNTTPMIADISKTKSTLINATTETTMNTTCSTARVSSTNLGQVCTTGNICGCNTGSTIPESCTRAASTAVSTVITPDAGTSTKQQAICIVNVACGCCSGSTQATSPTNCTPEATKCMEGSLPATKFVCATKRKIICPTRQKRICCPTKSRIMCPTKPFCCNTKPVCPPRCK